MFARFARLSSTIDRARNSRAAARMRAQSQSGSALLEFAFIAPVFFVLLFGIIEAGILFFSQSTLQFATNEVARLVRTGQVQAQAMTQAQFRTRVCNAIAPLVSCDARLQIDVRAFNSFTAASFGNPLDANGNLNPALNNYQPGGASDVVLVRVYYTWPVMTPVLTPFLVNMAGGSHLLSATAAFRNEPF
jgi:Flp pilus assembly protein TadG